MSEVGHSRHFEPLPVTSGLHPTSDINRPAPLVRLVPEAEFVLYAMRVSKKKSASGLTIEFIATCSEFTCSPCCLTYSYAACSRAKSGYHLNSNQVANTQREGSSIA